VEDKDDNQEALFMCRGNRVHVEPKTVVRISHHCGFARVSQKKISGLSLVALAVATLNGSSSARKIAEKWNGLARLQRFYV
jgi:hypothetical protein